LKIRRLEPLLIDRIAAGEVIERPAAAVKELVENSLDAGALRIDVAIEAGGRALIRVSDDGAGMGLDDLGLCVERHATSKLPDGDLNHIGTLGFRGEALPSIASVSRLEIRSRARGSEEAWVLRVEEGVKDAPRPAAHPGGTWIEARDLFAATPARLKFLKTDRAEAQACAEGVRRLALANPHARFSFASDIGAAFDYPACPEGVEGERERMRQALGEEFVDNALRLDYQREGVTLYGWVGLPTYNKPNALNQFVFVNGRGVRDKLISGACRGAYLDYLPRDRHGALALFVECDPADVDVNVHPAKAEVRFRESSLVRGLIVSGIRQALEAARHKAASTGGAGTLAALHAPHWRPPAPSPTEWDWRGSPAAPTPRQFDEEPAQRSFEGLAPSVRTQARALDEIDAGAPLGAARAQMHGTYILAQTRDGMVIVDQHAAHERIVYEKLKRQRAENGIARQMLLAPLVVDLDANAAAALAERAAEWEALGLVIEAFGRGAVLVREAPMLIASGDLAGLIRDLAEAALAEDGAESLERRLDHRLATIACHYSVRSGRTLRAEEMNALLREMEATPGAGQCNHGRPTYVELKLADIERLFGRR